MQARGHETRRGKIVGGKERTDLEWGENGGARDTISVYDSGIEGCVDQNDTLCLTVWSMCERSVTLSACSSEFRWSLN